jgi:hypothetical protein
VNAIFIHFENDFFCWNIFFCRQKLSKLIKDWCLPLSPFLCGLLVGILTGGLALAIIIALWLTSNNGKTSTAMGKR